MDWARLGEQAERLQRWVLFELWGPKVSFFRAQVDFFKGTTALWVLWLMHHFQNHSAAMYLYLFLHGSYGVCWVLKDLTFPDQRLQQPASVGSQCLLFLLLVGYWMIPLPLAAGYGVTEPSAARMAALVAMYVGGVALMMGADYQKACALRRRKGLVSSGFFRLTRNPNYLGELLIYSSFVLCAGHCLGFLVFYGAGGGLFALNIFVKDQCSYRRKEGWEEYRKRSYVLLPKLFSSGILNFALYTVLLLVLVWFFALESPATFFYPLLPDSGL